ncbi:mandelate racemase/muconate lactonizing enzyme family protein [Candidatus Poribacteria bacterium]|nr:mandelate racemase/muconate lactonizing enzyme family protein [Candidatus Poribacteria bacterium]MYB65946.1 mandelate racemase/muconate lactonizing enzyme family protein [Candidatus Poribacteria bacterium]MYF56734.1 mandelate racemase/muconate lactonizing enzyme family protein [Candidatus Poribacteria bacterium]
MKIRDVRTTLYDIPPQVKRTDAIQAFVSMEFPFIEIEDDDGVVGTGFSYTIGKGGEAIRQVIDAYLTPILYDEDASNIERIWNRMWMETHWVGRGGIVGLGIAAVDIALWDLMAKRANLPLYKLLGGAKETVPVYNTDGGWLHLTEDELVRQSVQYVEHGYKGIKIKVGRDNLHEDVSRIFAVRKAIGQEPYLMIDANMKWNAREATQLACRIEEADIFWFEEPIEADDVDSHVDLRQKTTIPIAIGETIYNKYVFQEYIAQGAADILQPDAVRVGGITEWMKVAHTAECFGLSVSPHFLMDLHVHLSAAVQHSLFVEFIPSLDPVLSETLELKDGHFSPPDRPGHGIMFDKDKLEQYRVS